MVSENGFGTGLRQGFGHGFGTGDSEDGSEMDLDKGSAGNSEKRIRTWIRKKIWIKVHNMDSELGCDKGSDMDSETDSEKALDVRNRGFGRKDSDSGNDSDMGSDMDSEKRFAP